MSYYTYKGNLRDRNKFTSTVQNDSSVKRYFSSLDTEVYIGSTRIDEIVAIDFTISEPKLPIYGYNSFYANRIVSGRRVVQGTFAINFTSVSYLLNILASAEDSVLASEYDTITYRCLDDDSTGLGIGNSDIFFKSFDLTISYGNGKSSNPSYNGCYQTLAGVQIVEYRQALDTEGNPILDMYSFIAKDIRYDTQIFEKASETNTESTNDDNVSETPLDISYICANQYKEEEMDELISKCTNTDLDGFIIGPTYNYTEKGCFIDLYLDAMNNKTEKVTNINVVLIDQSSQINYTCTIKDMTMGSSSIFELKDSLHNIGIQLYKNYKADNNYKCQCTVKFTATVDEEPTEISYSTELCIGEIL